MRPQALILGAALGLLSTLAQAQATPAGLWKTIDDATKKEKSLVRITDNGGAFSGKIEKLLDPASKPDAVCDKCSDDRKDKPILGMTIITGVRQSANAADIWDGGHILDPNDGKSYKVRLSPVDGGKKLDVRGYIGMPLLGRTQTWLRVE
ncbi:MAG: DUF2147 domain-containing protein [Ideonella sp.]|nr:DUF2147 domain-containing protein [Ideonella sp.]